MSEGTKPITPRKSKPRAKEPSTWAGIAGILAAVAPISGPAAPFVAAAAGVAGGLAVVLREGKPE